MRYSTGMEHDLELYVEIEFVNEGGETETDSTKFYYRGAEVELLGVSDISDIQDLSDAAYAIDCVTVAQMRDDVEEYVGGDARIIDFWIDWG